MYQRRPTATELACARRFAALLERDGERREDARCRRAARARRRRTSALHRLEEIPVRLGVLHLVEQEFDRGQLVHGVQELAQDPHLGELALVGDELFLARAGAVDVDRREYALLGDAPVEMDFAVAGALELLVDDVVHLRAGIDERRGEDRETRSEEHTSELQSPMYLV